MTRLEIKHKSLMDIAKLIDIIEGEIFRRYHAKEHAGGQHGVLIQEKLSEASTHLAQSAYKLTDAHNLSQREETHAQPIE